MGKKTVTTTQEIDEEEASAPTEPLDSDEIRALTDLEGAGEVTWSVHKVSQPGAGFLGELSTAELSHANIARLYGGGIYRVKGTRPNGQYFKSGRIMISAQFATPNSAPTSNGIDLEAIKQQLSKDNLMPLLLAMMSQNTTVITAALSRPSEQKREFPWAQLLIAGPALLTSIRDLMKSDAPDSVEKLLKELQLLEKLKGEDSKGSSWPDVVRETLSSLPALVTNVRSAAPAIQTHPVDARIVPDSPASVSHVAASESPATPPLETPIAVEPTETMVTLDFIKRRLSDLVEAAAKNKDPTLQAELLVEDFELLPSIVSDAMVRDGLMREDWFEKLQLIEPRVLNYQGWFDALRNEVMTLLTEEDNSNEPGNADHS